MWFFTTFPLTENHLAIKIRRFFSWQLSSYHSILRNYDVGKKILGVRIVRYDNARNPGFLRVVVLRYLILKPIWMIPILGQLFVLADALFIFGDNRRCIHDLVARTKVIVANKLE